MRSEHRKMEGLMEAVIAGAKQTGVGDGKMVLGMLQGQSDCMRAFVIY